MRESPILWALFLILAGLQPTSGDDNIDSLMDMSLEDLSKIKVTVPAALTKLSSNETPASITTLTSEDIARTPARNIYDLIEVYVPGALWMNYEEGPVLGIRGSMTERAYKYLLRVNGRVVNNKGHYGAKSELEQWDLEDIQRIEVVRGPGSVVYGPGAVAGIINIVTHDAKSAPGLKVTSRYISEYNSSGLSISNGRQGEHIDLFAYASMTWTEGISAPNFQGGNNNVTGFIGDAFLPDTEPLDYFGDYNNDPQIKAHLDATLYDNWRVWLRYTQQGSHWNGNEAKSDFGGVLLNQQGTRDRQWIASLEYETRLREDLTVTAMLSADSSDVERRKSDVIDPDPDHVLQLKTNFSETEIQFRGLLNWQTSEKVEFAIGAEYSWDSFGPGWGDNKDEMRIGDDGVIVSGVNSLAFAPGRAGSADKNGTALFADDGWTTSTFSIFSEINMVPKPWLTALLSARMDKNELSDPLFSPRIALIAKIAEGQHLKFIGQQAQRLNTGGQLYSLDHNDKNSDPETITSFEVIYTLNPVDNLSMSIAGFWNDLEVVSWNEDDDTTRPLGDLKLYGIEPELTYTGKKGKIGVSYSYVKQYDWNLAEGVNSSGVSYSAYNQPLSGSTGIQVGTGDDLNNWFNQSFKFYERLDLSHDLLLHVDGQILWGFEGGKDGLQGLRDAVAGLPEEAAVLSGLQQADDEGVYDYQFRLSASLSWMPSDKLSLQFFAQNILGSDDSKRYSFDTGSNKASPHRIRFTEEPRMYGIRLGYNF